MKNYLYFLGALIIIVSCDRPGNQAEGPVLNEWQDLITNDLDQWIITDDIQHTIDDQILYLETKTEDENNWLLSEQEYSNFEFEAEFLPTTHPGGILVRYHDRSNATVEGSGYLISLDHDADQANPIGTIFGAARSTVLEDTNAEDWTKVAVKANGDHLKVFINGQLVAESHDRKRIRGKLGIRIPKVQGEQAAFRKIKIKMLPELEITEPLLEDQYRSSTDAAFEPLFEDGSLDSWKPIGDGKWEISDGVLHGYSGEKGGFLVSEKTYKNFYLKCDFKIIKEDNSGIFIRKSPDSTSVTTTDAIECNIYDHNGPAHAYSTGSIATHARAWYGMIDYTDWNTMEIFAREDHVVMFVNDQKSSEGHLPSQFNKAGNICLQGGIKVFSEDKGPSDIYFRNMMIKNMDGI
ncbi:MAG: 3-keto-disaccharide hydrolase [Cyclobacteriaceae bacterium]